MEEKKIKVYLQSPWRKGGECSYYKYLRQDLPKNIRYINKESSTIIQSSSKLIVNNWLKQLIKTLIKKSYPSMPNAHYTRNAEKCDLIHCAHCLSLNNKPWVADFEWPGQFWVSGTAYKSKKKQIKKLLTGKYCKKIMCWTKATQKEILKIFPEIENKIEVVYPATPLPKFKKIKSKKIRLLYISRLFYEKGGLHAIEVLDKLTKKYDNVEGIFISQTPENILKKYSKNKKIKFFSLMPQEEIFTKIYPKTDILIYPAYIDTFGFALTEAPSFGIPVITVEGFSRKEIIENGKTGFVVQRPKNLDYCTLSGQEKIIQKIVKKASILIENKKLREKMSKNARKEIKEGKFSMKKRNEKLKRIYEEALK